MNKECEFLLKVVRNGLILSGLYFVSVWGSNQELTLLVCKPVMIFLGTYVLVELAKRYGLDYKITKINEGTNTLIL